MPIRTQTLALILTLTLWGEPWLDAVVACEVRPWWVLCFGRRVCCALAVVDAVLLKDAPPIWCSRLNPINTYLVLV